MSVRICEHCKAASEKIVYCVFWRSSCNSYWQVQGYVSESSAKNSVSRRRKEGWPEAFMRTLYFTQEGEITSVLEKVKEEGE